MREIVLDTETTGFDPLSGDRIVELTAREVSGAERDHWWRLAVEAFPPYAEYQTNTKRQIPVFVLD